MKPCPFCGAELEDIKATNEGQKVFMHPSENCFIDMRYVYENELEAWNMRRSKHETKTE